jgi:hypothetical protein
MESIKLAGAYPARIGHVSRWPGIVTMASRARTPAQTAEKIDDHVVILHFAMRPRSWLQGRLGVDDAFEDTQYAQRLDIKSGFLADFTLDGACQFFANLDQAARYRPLALKGFLPAANQQHPAAVDHDASDAHAGMVWKLALVGVLGLRHGAPRY